MRLTRPVMKSQKRTHAELTALQSLPLETKILWALEKIQEWYEYFDGKVCVSFSGGKDSTVLLNLVRSVYPEVPAVFSDTGLEWPEIREFVKTIDNVTWVKPKMNFKQVLEKYGYPIISKKVARHVHDIRMGGITRNLRLTGLNQKGVFCSSHKTAKKWLFLVEAPFKISDRCCDVMKKNPLKLFQKQYQLKTYIGTMADDSEYREKRYLKYGCNAFDLSDTTSQPLSIWLEQDILKFIKINNLPFCKIYGTIRTKRDGKYYCTGEHNTGCIFCGFGIAREKGENRFQRMKKTHPELWKYCMDNLGLREVLAYCNIPIEKTGMFF